MKIVIDLPVDLYCEIQAYKTVYESHIGEIADAICKGTPLPQEQEPCECTEHPCLGKLCRYYKQPCEDAISRQAVLEQINCWSKDEFLRVTNPFDYLRKRINSLPPVTPQPKTGRWIYIQYDGNPQIGNWKCSLCMRNVMFGQNQNDKPLYNYCPRCGAKMQEAEE